MEVVGDCKGLLSNCEVLLLLKEIKETKRKKEHKNLATVAYESIKYLEDTPANQQNPEVVADFLRALKAKGFRLTKAEKLQILNHRPATLVELQLLVEESEERFSEKAMNEILEVVERTLPALEEPNPDVGSEEGPDQGSVSMETDLN